MDGASVLNLGQAMEATEFLNAQDPMSYESLANLDHTLPLAGSGIWELPFGQKWRWGSSRNRAVDFVAGGWQPGGLNQHQSDALLGFGNRVFNGRLEHCVAK